MDMLNDVMRGQLPGGVGDILARFQNQNQDPSAVTDEEAHSSYGQVATQLSPDEYRQAAEAAFARLTPEQRSQFLNELQSAAERQGVSAPTPTTPSPTAQQTADAAAAVHAQQPNLLQQLMGPGGTFSSPIAKLAMLGITAFAAQRLVGPRR
jgi:hypothetical protein